MAEDNHWVIHTLEGMLPEETYEVLYNHVLNPQTPVQMLRRQAMIRLQQALDVIRPYTQVMVDRAMGFLADSPEFVSVAIVLGVLALALQMVFWVHRIMMFWTRLAMKAIMWAVIAAIVAVVWQRGPEAAFHDVLVFAGKLAGYATIIKEIWLSEYQKYDAQTKNSRKMGNTRSRRAGR